MTGDQFIKAAAKIAATYTTPVFSRIAINRAYYGAFHLTKAFLSNIGVKSPKNDNTHVFVQRRIANCKYPPGALIGQLLADLYRDRLKADYDLDDSDVDKNAYARERVETATTIQTQLAACDNASAKEQIIKGIAQYEAKIESK